MSEENIVNWKKPETEEVKATEPPPKPEYPEVTVLTASGIAWQGKLARIAPGHILLVDATYAGNSEDASVFDDIVGLDIMDTTAVIWDNERLTKLISTNSPQSRPPQAG